MKRMDLWCRHRFFQNLAQYELVEASDVVEDEKKLKDAVRLVRTFVNNPDRTMLTVTFIKSLELLANTVENQLGEVM